MVASILTGGQEYPISQGFGVNLPNVPDDWYAYAVDYGLDYGDHPGLDIATPLDTNIYAVGDGEIIQAGESPYFRPFPVYQRLSNGLVVIYGHLRGNAVESGQTVRKGDLIGKSGEQTVAGNPYLPDGSGPHIHLEVRNAEGTRVIDPMQILEGTADDPINPGDSAPPGQSAPWSGSSELLMRAGGTVAGVILLGVGVFMVAALARSES